MAEIILENNQDKLLFGDELSETIKAVIEKTLYEEGCDFSAEVSVTIVDADTIRKINKEQRNIDAVTDVLSFPMLEFDENREIIDSEFDMDGESLMLGDIVICAERAIEQAEEYGHSREREIVYLFVHSVLHLLGYDHMEEEEKHIMRTREEEIMRAVELPR